MIHRAEVLQQDMHPDESIALLEKIIADNPTAAFYTKLGSWLMRKQDFKKAVSGHKSIVILLAKNSQSTFIIC